MIQALHKNFLESSGVCTDTRTLQPRQVFFALKGESFNGNLFAVKAIESGAHAVVIDEDIEMPDGARVFRVNSALETLQELAAYHRNYLGKSVTVVGLTGSNGKTTTKELMQSVCQTSFRSFATAGNLNNHIGVPLTLLAIPADCELVLVEMGANHKREIALLSSLADPDIGYITHFGKAHLEGFGGIEGVIEGKSELYRQLEASGGLALINDRDPIQVRETENIKRISFGSANADYPIEPIDRDANAAVKWNGLEFTSSLTGQFHANNIAAAVALGLHLKIDPKDIQRGISAYQPKNNRSEWRKTDRNFILLDAYNANPDSMSATIRAFAKETNNKGLIVLGDMFEIGKSSAEEHQKIIDQLESTGIERAFLVGEVFSKCKVRCRYLRFKTTDECLDYLRSHPEHGQNILLKGSRKMQLEKLLEAL